jgi:hypothetical protein
VDVARDFQEATLGKTAIRDLGLTIAGTPLEPILARFEGELVAAGIRTLRPRFYLSTEWGVPTDTIAVAIPFYLARGELTTLHARRTGHVEGTSADDVLRYLRHEMGHVVNYAYRLYDRPDWVQRFGAITQPYVDDYRPQPFSRRYVVHLPGWYAQKHPDEDFAETFAVWLTPGRDWRAEYGGWPALDKLEYVDAVMAALDGAEPLVTAADLDADVAEIDSSLDEFYAGLDVGPAELPGLDGALRALFEELDGAGERRPARVLFERLEQALNANVYRWTGHFPERTRGLVRHLANRADALGLSYRAEREAEATVAATTMVTALAMNHVHTGSYLP